VRLRGRAPGGPGGSRGQGGLEHDQRGQVVAAVADLAALPISGLLLEH
jgi:hypothetical protein